MNDNTALVVISFFICIVVGVACYYIGGFGLIGLLALSYPFEHYEKRKKSENEE